MKHLRKITALLLLLALVLGILASCELVSPDADDKVTLEITGEGVSDGRLSLKLGASVRLYITSNEDIASEVSWSASNSNVTVADDGTVTATAIGKVTVTAAYGDITAKVMIEVTDNTEVTLAAEKYFLEVGESTRLLPQILPEGKGGTVYYSIAGNDEGDPYISIYDGEITALRAGGAVQLTAHVEGSSAKSEPITITTLAKDMPKPTAISLLSDKDTLMIGESAELIFTVSPVGAAENITFYVTRGADSVEIRGSQITGVKAGEVTVYGMIGDVRSNDITLTVKNVSLDPYENMSRDEFYENYTPATSYMDSYYRSLHYLMSGDIVTPDQAPEISPYRPMKNGAYIRNTESFYSDSGNTYNVVDAYGNEVMEIYRSGAYITLEEVAAYVFAFGTIPVNYDTNKNASPRYSEWGEYLRCNNSKFSGSTSKYPYEPELPNISGCGGSLQYREIDIGTTGTTAGEGYAVKIYNDGNTITRGAARIVYARDDLDGDGVYEQNEHYVFYTYNHYNDFQEYLNYYGGWGEMFGNETGGGTLSSKYDCNPTPYVPVYWGALASLAEGGGPRSRWKESA